VIRRHFLIVFACLGLLLGTPWTVARAADIEINQIKFEPTEEGYVLGANYEFELNHGLEEAVLRGFPLFFTTELELTRPRWYWLDEKAIVTRQTMRLSYNVLTRQYYVAVLGSVHQSYSTLGEALSLIRRPHRWLVAGKGIIKPGETYHGKLRMRLDIQYLSKPIQINAINNSDWRLSSEKKSFTFKADDK
jgi:Domain of unknown function (DUF4390)